MQLQLKSPSSSPSPPRLRLGELGLDSGNLSEVRQVHIPPLHYVHFVKYDDAVSFYDAVSDTIRRRGGNRGIFTEEGVDTVAYFGDITDLEFENH